MKKIHPLVLAFCYKIVYSIIRRYDYEMNAFLSGRGAVR